MAATALFRNHRLLNIDLVRTRFAKLYTSLLRPTCWVALRHGVAPSVEHMPFLRSLKIDGVIDVGANRGQFSLASRLVMPKVSIVSFEPIPHEAEIFRKVHRNSSNVELIESALGEQAGTATLHLSKSLDSSSLLPIGKKQTDLFSNTAEVGTIEVAVSRLDDFGDRWKSRTNQLLKIDVQGFELSVLRGAVETLRTCRYVYVECSEVTLYEGQALRPEVSDFLAQHGFCEEGRYNEQWEGSQLIQADYLYRNRVS